ncbi:unnamed protein product [Macrosiphum euphorbiae]|uniref:RNA-directed DNA polymerase n=1 Tax=Macrosiphum euphorbiae TaxID=13131 RepID=A0AAV0XFZ1_9HEMI|nr:unnamed protein product [Macrosiphum euphorbiae]
MLGQVESYVPGDDFCEYAERLEQYFVLNDVKVDKKVAFLLTFIGQETYSILKKLLFPGDPVKKTFEQLIAVLKSHFTPEVNEISERYKFFKEDQKSGQPMSEYIVELKAKAQKCKFETFLNQALRDRLVFGVCDNKLRAILLKESTLTFESACTIAINWELSEKDVKGQSMNQFTVRPKSSNFHTNRSKSVDKRDGKCTRCGGSHFSKEECPVRNWKCRNCDKVGHIAKYCFYSKMNQSKPRARSSSRSKFSKQKYRSSDSVSSEKNNVHELSEELDQMQCYVESKMEDRINSVHQSGSPLLVTVIVQDNEVEMEVDSGACASLISEDMYLKMFSFVPLIDVVVKFVSVTGENVKLSGKLLVNVRLPGDIESKTVRLELFVIKSKKPCVPLLGRAWLDRLYPSWRNVLQLNQVSKSSNILDTLAVKYPNVIPKSSNQVIKNYKAEIVLKDNVKPIFHKAYTVPFKLREKVNVEIDRLVNEGILEPVKFSEWASPIVIVPKSNGSIRICVDCKVTINKFIQTQHYPLPNIEDLFASMASCAVFCVLDLSGAYQQLELASSSKEYLTINTLKGLFRFTRLTFGVASAPAIFQSTMDQILLGLENVFCYLDDILIGEKTVEKCRQKLDLVLDRLNNLNVSINVDKCKFFEKEVDYLGHTLSDKGIRPQIKKLEAIREARAPNNVTELQAYLGLLNYYGKFIPNISSELHDLYKLLRKDVKFVWSDKCQEVFEKSKTLLLQNQVLEIYDQKKPIVVCADGSPYGVGAILSQVVDGVEKPVLFASSSLSPAEQKYSQLHREALAIVFALKKFHKYIYGNKFTLCSDAQALREIFSPQKGTAVVAASRLQRWAVLLSMYEYEFQYRPSKQMVHVDALSRLPLNTGTEIEDDVISRLCITNEFRLSTADVVEALKKDKIVFKVYNYVLRGWPGKVESEIEYYFKLKDNLSTQDDCLFFGDRIVVPEVLKKNILKILHKDHEGIVRMKMAARSVLWWKNMNTDIEKFSKGCEICDQTSNVSKEKVISKWPMVVKPWERVHVDFFHLEGNTFLVVIDAYSKYIVVKLLKKTNCESLIRVLQEVFAFFGLPEEIVSDNGPPFGSWLFNSYGNQSNIKITKTPPFHSQSNGLAERAVQTVKKYFKKYILDRELNNLTVKEKVVRFITVYNTTPSTVTAQSPADRMFSYKLRSILSSINPKSKVTVKEKKKLSFNLKNNKYYEDENSENYF